MAEIAKAFAGNARRREQLEKRIERLSDRVQRHLVGDPGVEPRAGEVATDIQAVETGHAPDNADISGVWPRAAIRAAGDADAEPLALEPIMAQPSLDGSHDVVAYSLGLGQCQAAARQTRAGERPALDGRDVRG
jgi:hypothetical protein